MQHEQREQRSSRFPTTRPMIPLPLEQQMQMKTCATSSIVVHWKLPDK